MSSVDFNITLCIGGHTDETVPDCPVREQCKRLWTQEHTNAAREQGINILEQKVYVPISPSSITENGCEYFLER